MPRPTVDREAEKLDEHRQVLRQTVQRVETAHAAGYLRVADVHLVYEATLLSFHTMLEQRLEEVIVGLLLGRTRVGGETVVPRVRIPSKPLALAVLRGDRQFVDWMPITQTEDRIDRLMRGTWPENRLDRGDRAALARLHRIRNAIAHRSTEARQRFIKADLPSGSPPSHREPSVFLRSGRNTNAGAQLEKLMASGTVAFTRLCRSV